MNEPDVLKEIGKLKWARLIILAVTAIATVILFRSRLIRPALALAGSVGAIVLLFYSPLENVIIRRIAVRSGKSVEELRREIEFYYEYLKLR